MTEDTYNQILQQLNLIQQFLDGTIAQINAMSQTIEDMGKSFAESMANAETFGGGFRDEGGSDDSDTGYGGGDDDGGYGGGVTGGSFGE